MESLLKNLLQEVRRIRVEELFGWRNRKTVRDHRADMSVVTRRNRKGRAGSASRNSIEAAEPVDDARAEISSALFAKKAHPAEGTPARCIGGHSAGTGGWLSAR